MLLAVDNKKWLFEIVIAVCLIAAAIGGFFLLGGRTLLTSLIHK
jgi:hypothetical protein